MMRMNFFLLISFLFLSLNANAQENDSSLNSEKKNQSKDNAKDWVIYAGVGVDYFNNDPTSQYFSSLWGPNLGLKKFFTNDFSGGLFLEFLKGSDEGAQYEDGLTFAEEVTMKTRTFGGEIEYFLSKNFTLFARGGFWKEEEITEDGSHNWEPMKGYKYKIGSRSYFLISSDIDLNLFVEGAYSFVSIKENPDGDTDSNLFNSWSLNFGLSKYF